MEKQMVQCEDGRRRQARILKGKHVSGEAWYSYQTKTWYFIIDPEGKHGHLMDRINDTLRGEKVRMLRDQLKQLESRQVIEQKKIAEHRKALEAVESEIETVKDDIAKLEKGVPLESGTQLKYSSAIKRN
jgi:hypothetical protein